MTARKADFRAAGDGPRAKPEVLSSLRFVLKTRLALIDSGDYRRCRDASSLLHMKALAPQRHIVSFRRGTAEPQPPPHAHSVVAWPIVKARILQWPTNQISRFTPLTWSESLPSSQHDKLIRRPPNLIISHSSNITVRGARSYNQTATEELTIPFFVIVQG